MRRMLVCVLLTALFAAGCSDAVDHRSDVRRLTELCGHVNLALAGLKPTVDPGRFAEQFRDLVNDISELDAPQEDLEQRRRLVASFEDVSQGFTMAAEAKQQGDDALAEAEATAAEQRLRRTSEIATEYGMPPLKECAVRATLAPTPPPGSGSETAQSVPTAPSEVASGSEPPESRPSATAVAWHRLGDLELMRQQFASTEVDGAIYITGGLVRSQATKDVAVLDPAVDEWRSGPQLPFAMHHHMAVTLDGQPVVLGGWRFQGGDPSGRVSDQVFILDGDGWRRLPPLQRPRAAGAAAVVDGEIIVVGGQNADGLVTQTEIFDGQRWRDAAPILTPREHVAAAADERFVYAVGGRNERTDTNVATLERYNPATDTWRTLPPMQGPRGSMDADVVDGRLVVVGGEAPRRPLGTAEAYDIRSQTWSTLPSLETPRHGLGVVGSRGRVYVIGGAETIGHARSSNVVEVLDMPPRRRQPTEWRSRGDADIARQQAAIARDEGSLWVIGGLDEEIGATSSVDALDPRFNIWRPGVELPEPLHHAMAVNLDGALVVIGGWIPVGGELTGEVSGNVYILRDGTDEWEPLASLNSPRAAGAAAVVGDQIVVVGGRDRDGLVRPTEIYDSEADTWQIGEDIPTGREHLAGVAIGGFVYAAGGRALSASENTDALERYDPEADRWERLEPMLTARGSIGATVAEGRMIVVGGETNDEVLPTVEFYDPQTDSWVPGPDLRTPRHGAAVGIRGSTVYVIGGATKTLHRATTREVEILQFR